VAYVMLVFLPGRRAVGEARDRIEQMQNYLAQATELTGALQITEEELQVSQAYNLAWEEDSPNRNSLSELYGRISALAKTAGTVTTRFDPEPVITHDTIKEIPLSLGCTGSYAQVFAFLQSLEGLPMEIWVKSCSIVNSDTRRGFADCDLTVVVFADNPRNSDYVESSE